MATAMANGETYKYSDEDMQMGGSVQSTQDGRIIAVIGGHNYKSGDLNKAYRKTTAWFINETTIRLWSCLQISKLEYC